MAKTLVHTVITQLQEERIRLQRELHRVSAALIAFGKVYTKGSAPATPARRKHKISAEGRKRIAAAQKARWAKAKTRRK